MKKLKTNEKKSLKIIFSVVLIILAGYFLSNPLAVQFPSSDGSSEYPDGYDPDGWMTIDQYCAAFMDCVDDSLANYGCSSGFTCINCECINAECSSGETKCEGTIFYECSDYKWDSQGKVIGECGVECTIDSQCNPISYSDPFCSENNVIMSVTIPSCSSNKCEVSSSTEVVEVCSSNCENGVCIYETETEIIVYRLENNECNYLSIYVDDRTSNDYYTLTQCQSNIDDSTNGSELNITLISVIILSLIGGGFFLIKYLKKSKK